MNPHFAEIEAIQHEIARLREVVLENERLYAAEVKRHNDWTDHIRRMKKPGRDAFDAVDNSLMWMGVFKERAENARKAIEEAEARLSKAIADRDKFAEHLGEAARQGLTGEAAEKYAEAAVVKGKTTRTVMTIASITLAVVIVVVVIVWIKRRRK